jgi:glucose/arabinose dehydrogenase
MTPAVVPAACGTQRTSNDSSGFGRGHHAGAVDAVPGPDGALYVSDDQAGAIYRIVPAKRP